MSVFHWKFTRPCQYAHKKVKDNFRLFKELKNTLCYNQFTTSDSCLDTCTNPLTKSADFLARLIGPLFIVLATVLITSVVGIFYSILLPHYIETSLFLTCFHLAFGHWLLIMIAFNYFMAAKTPPGKPPLGSHKDVAGVVGMCRHCVSPKPPRAHHCSICKGCVLKMDHHCPWLNNCVGFYNHRYFFMFIFYIWLGTMYVMASDFGLFWDIYNTEGPLSRLQHMNTTDQVLDPLNKAELEDLRKELYWELAYRKLVQYEFYLCLVSWFALLLLMLWHGALITNGETSIEWHINRGQSRLMAKAGAVYKNPYHYGWKENWRLLLGLTKGRTIWRHILLPSRHTPEGNGVYWSMVAPLHEILVSYEI